MAGPMYRLSIYNVPFIIETSFAPSPIANVIAFLDFLISSSTWAFWIGLTLQQITAGIVLKVCEVYNYYLKISKIISPEQDRTTSRKSSFRSGFKA
jgi:hypothetical protein